MNSLSGRIYLFAAAAVMAFLFTGCASAPKECPECARAAALTDCSRNIFLPEKIYAVPGVECNIYFKNVFLAVNHANYIFDVDCAAGMQQESRWVFTPQPEDAGKNIPLKLTVFDQYGRAAARAEATVCVGNPDAGKDKEISILMIGDSLTDATEYPRQLKRLCADSPRLKMIGSNGGRGKPPAEGVLHEGYSGWKYKLFMSRYLDENTLPPRQRYSAKSKFLVKKDGKLELDFAQYFEKYNAGDAPDVITIQLGVNDIFGASADNVDKYISDILNDADKFISAIRKAAPDTLIGIGYVTGGSNQDSFGVNYKCGKTSWNYYHNHFKLNQAMAEHFRKSSDRRIVMIPVNVNLDTVHNFPVKKERAAARSSQIVVRQNNGVHPDYYGYRQMADSYYMWLKNVMQFSGN